MSVDGEYITRRLFPSFVQEACRDLDISHQSFSGDWIHTLQKNDIQKWVIGYSFDINSTAASGLARDKVGTYQALAASDLPAVEHYLARSRAMSEVLRENLLAIEDDRPIVIKPLEGASGHGVHRFANKAEAADYLVSQPHTDWAMSPWYDIASEVRLTLLDGDVLCAYEKQQPSTREGLLLYNLGTGAIAVDIEPDDELTTLAQKAQRACGLRLCAVDIVRFSSGELRVLEVNEGIMMEHYARQSGTYRQRASVVYKKIIEAMLA